MNQIDFNFTKNGFSPNNLHRENMKVERLEYSSLIESEKDFKLSYQNNYSSIRETQNEISELNQTNSDENESINAFLRKSFMGIVKFFDKKKKFGFIIIDNEKRDDIFFHYNDVLDKNKLSINFLNSCNKMNLIKVKFKCAVYINNNDKNLKAISIEFVKLIS